MVVRISDYAMSDLTEIYAYIRRESELYAKRTLERLFKVMSSLEKMPLSGRMIPKFSDPALREMFHGNYRIAYQVAETEIIILTVHHISKLSQV